MPHPRVAYTNYELTLANLHSGMVHSKCLPRKLKKEYIN